MALLVLQVQGERRVTVRGVVVQLSGTILALVYSRATPELVLSEL
jgi:hypothetical protein